MSNYQPTVNECSFCGEMKQVMEGQDGYICEDCIKHFASLIGKTDEKEQPTAKVDKTAKVVKMSPVELKARLDEYIIGQEEAKEVLSVVVSNHYKRINSNNKMLDKSNILILGPTGCGKTHLMKTLSMILNVPMVIADATNYTRVGYVGDDVASIIRKLYVEANGDIDACQRGIVYIDEVDKLVSKDVGVNSSDATGTGVQQNMLKIMESGIVTVDIHTPQGTVTKKDIDTKNILFIFGGAFVGLKKAESGSKIEKGIGFGAEKSVSKQGTDKFTHEDIIKYGFIPEFIGRIPVIVQLHELTKADLVNILTNNKNSVFSQYKELFGMDGIDVEYNADMVEWIVSETMKNKMGARGIRSIVDSYMIKVMYEASKYKDIKKITIDQELMLHPETVSRWRSGRKKISEQIA